MIVQDFHVSFPPKCVSFRSDRIVRMAEAVYFLVTAEKVTSLLGKHIYKRRFFKACFMAYKYLKGQKRLS